MIRAALLSLIVAQGAWAQTAPEPADYRMEEYRSPVPETLAGATVVDAEAAHALWQSGAAFVDVLPRPPKPAKLPEETLWREKPRYSIPGAIWLPNTGYGALAPVMEDYFRAGLEKVTGGDPDRPLVVFCLEDCWMSWNAAKRAMTYGYTAVHWLPGGTDDWGFYDFPTEEIQPEPGDQ